MPPAQIVQAVLCIAAAAAILTPLARRLPTLPDNPAGRWAKRWFWISVAAFVAALVVTLAGR